MINIRSFKNIKSLRNLCHNQKFFAFLKISRYLPLRTIVLFSRVCSLIERNHNKQDSPDAHFRQTKIDFQWCNLRISFANDLNIHTQFVLVSPQMNLKYLLLLIQAKVTCVIFIMIGNSEKQTSVLKRESESEKSFPLCFRNRSTKEWITIKLVLPNNIRFCTISYSGCSSQKRERNLLIPYQVDCRDFHSLFEMNLFNFLTFHKFYGFFFEIKFLRNF